VHRQIEEDDMKALLHRIACWLNGGPTLRVVVGDITTQHVDAIVNAANPSLLGGGGVDGAIHRAGGPAILAACRRVRRNLYREGLPVGWAVATTAGDMPANLVIHTVGPDQRIGQTDPALLRDCYVNSLHMADDLDCETVAFPLISAGVYGWPKQDAIAQAIGAIRSVKTVNVKQVRLVLFNDEELRIANSLIKR
jgi:O-acetyl-ADP-ribose deacetylase (regulator of RNase III)